MPILAAQRLLSNICVMEAATAAIAASTFMMHVGARHITFDMTNAQRKLMQHPAMKGLVLFAMFFMTTRNPYLACLLTFVYFLLILVLLNETHDFNIFSKNWLMKHGLYKKENQKSYLDSYINNINSIAI